MRKKQAHTEKHNLQKEIKKKCSLTWAILIKMVYEVDPLICPNCGEAMKIISLIDKKQNDVINRILKHCDLWQEDTPRPPPEKETPVHEEQEDTISYDFDFFNNVCA